MRRLAPVAVNRLERSWLVSYHLPLGTIYAERVASRPQQSAPRQGREQPARRRGLRSPLLGFSMEEENAANDQV
ncbi:unnamed protein product [Sphagnum jensenii]|uniref:Uncharacterized protein n=1 Tax=Sphagnum jensenii TaxID=128206 RepID=A0ABP0VGI5_9BRYO